MLAHAAGAPSLTVRLSLAGPLRCSPLSPQRESNATRRCATEAAAPPGRGIIIRTVVCPGLPADPEIPSSIKFPFPRRLPIRQGNGGESPFSIQPVREPGIYTGSRAAGGGGRGFPAAVACLRLPVRTAPSARGGPQNPPSLALTRRPGGRDPRLGPASPSAPGPGRARLPAALPTFADPRPLVAP